MIDPLLQKNFDKPFSENETRNMWDLAAAVKTFKDVYGHVANFLAAKPGYKYVKGEITTIPAILVIVSEKIKLNFLTTAEQLPNEFQGFDVEVVEASPKEKIRYEHQFNKSLISDFAAYLEPSTLESLVLEDDELEVFALGANKGLISYVPPPNIKLDEVNAAMTILCHVSPEAGWKTLKPFLEGVQKHLQVAMYDFTAPQIIKTISGILADSNKTVKIVYDGKAATGLGQGTKVNDIPEDVTVEKWKNIAGSRFECMEAWKGGGGICKLAYHTKVAVRDKKSFWLSSGNWQTSNQPDADFTNDPKNTANYNREWHVVVENEKLSNIFHAFIDYDFTFSSKKPSIKTLGAMLPEIFIPVDVLEEQIVLKIVKLFNPQKFVFTEKDPVRIQPILTPDNYLDHAKNLIKSAKHSIYFQNQYITRKGKTITAAYDELLNLLCDATKNPEIDCKILLRKPYSTADKMELLNDLQAMGYRMDAIKFMDNTHTKGIIVDGERIMIGSHNWSNSGVEFNRDASLLIYNEGIAQYYKEIFEHDWQNRVEGQIKSFSLGDDKESFEPREMVQVDWDEYFS